MRVHLNRAHFPVTALGHGNRIGIWVQGCSIHCPGCISRDTWDPASGEIELSELLALLEGWLVGAHGLTISGGEPFEQPEFLSALLDWWRAHSAGDVLVYSGYAFEKLQASFPALLSNMDVLISDPFDAAAGQSLPLRGSDNQRMHLLTPLGRERYEQLTHSHELDVCWDGDRVWFAGIPRPSDLTRLRHALSAAGVDASTSEQPSRVRA